MEKARRVVQHSSFRRNQGQSGFEQPTQYLFRVPERLACASFCLRRGLGRIGYAPPGIVRIERRHASSDASGVRAQILFVEAALVAEEKRRRRFGEPIWPGRFCH